MAPLDIARCYRLLEVDPGASREEIRKAYLVLVNVWHPDRFQHDVALQAKALRKLQAVNLAFATIRDAPLARTVEAGPPPRSREEGDRPAPAPAPATRATSTAVVVRSASEWTALGRGLTADPGRLRSDDSGLAWSDISNLNRFLEGVHAFREALKVDRRYVEAWYGLGLAHVALKEHDQAIQAFEKAVGLDRDHAAAWLGLGSALAQHGRHGQAAAAFGEVVRLRPNDVAAWYALGSARVRIGEVEQAVSAFRRAVELDPDVAEAWQALGTARAFPGPDGRVEPEEALEAFREAVRLRPDLAEGWHCLGATLSGLGRHDEAVAALQQAVRLGPDSAEFWYSLGVAARYASTANATRAVREAYARLKRLDPTQASRLRELLPYSMKLSLLAFLPRVDRDPPAAVVST